MTGDSPSRTLQLNLHCLQHQSFVEWSCMCSMLSLPAAHLSHASLLCWHGKRPIYTRMHVIAVAHMQLTLSHAHGLKAMFDAQHSHIYLVHIATSRHQGIYACLLMYYSVEQVKSVLADSVSTTLLHYTTGVMVQMTFGAGLALTLLSSSKAMSC